MVYPGEATSFLPALILKVDGKGPVYISKGGSYSTTHMHGGTRQNLRNNGDMRLYMHLQQGARSIQSAQQRQKKYQSVKSYQSICVLETLWRHNEETLHRPTSYTKTTRVPFDYITKECLNNFVIYILY